MEILEKILLLVFCHLIGDYVLQIDFIAKTKGINFYHLLVHCLLYIVPFYIVFGMGWQLWISGYSIVEFIFPEQSAYIFILAAGRADGSRSVTSLYRLRRLLL